MKVDIDFFVELLRVRSVSQDVEATNCATELMHNYLSKHGLYCVVEEVAGRKVLYAATEQTKQPDYLLNAHLDVVPALEEQFEPRVEGDHVIARGASDCKGNALVVAQAMIACQGKASVGAFFTADEEIGGETSAGMVALGYGAKKIVLVVDAGAYEITCAQKGTAHYKLVARETGGHSATPWQYRNPIDRLIDGYVKIREAWPEMTPDRWSNSLALTMFHAGRVANQVPDVAEMTVNCRYIHDGDDERIATWMREISGLEVTCLGGRPPIFCDESHAEIVRLRRVMETIFVGKKIGTTRMHGATDASHFKSIGVPIAILGTFGMNCHAEDEWESLSNMSETIDMLVAFCSGDGK